VSNEPKPALVLAIRDIAIAAGRAILAVRNADVRHKADRSPLTAADEASDRLIVAALERLTPEIPIVSEERVTASPRAPGPRYWLVDPLDGTREFLAGNGEYTVNIALIEGDRPVLGVVHVPPLATTYYASGPGQAFRQAGDRPPQPITARVRPPGTCIALASRSHGDPETDALLAREGVSETRRVGSAVKFGLIAAGEADLYPRFAPTLEWDTAAGHAVLTAAGGSVATPDGAPLRYGKPGFRNGPFIARGRH
jgi:3'(2'), 5'-bisphosphate nucleotidase